jgi:hypothetical protein
MTELRSDAELLGRDGVDDLDAILDLRSDPDAVLRSVRDHAPALFTWDYERSRAPLSKLYEKAKTAQWNATTDLPWETEVDQEMLAATSPMQGPDILIAAGVDFTGTSFEKWTKKEWTQAAIEQQNWTLSQFLHGEQGALLCTAKIVETVPWIDAKYYASTQVMDEARHVEVFARYLDEKMNGHYPIDPHLALLLDDVIADERQEFAFEAAVRMRDRLVGREVWDRMGIDPKEAMRVLNPFGDDKNRDPFQMLLFSKIVPNLSKLGLLDANNGWLRTKFDGLGVTQFETWTDTTIEYEMLDAVTADREEAAAG